MVSQYAYVLFFFFKTTFVIWNVRNYQTRCWFFVFLQYLALTHTHIHTRIRNPLCYIIVAFSPLPSLFYDKLHIRIKFADRSWLWIQIVLVWYGKWKLYRNTFGLFPSFQPGNIWKIKCNFLSKKKKKTKVICAFFFFLDQFGLDRIDCCLFSIEDYRERVLHWSNGKRSHSSIAFTCIFTCIIHTGTYMRVCLVWHRSRHITDNRKYTLFRGINPSDCFITR